VANGGEDSDLVECVLFLFSAEIHYLDSLEGVDLAILQALHLVYCGIGSLA